LVKLVVRSLLEGLGSFNRLADLRRRLEDLPRDLEDLKSVKPAFYLDQAAKLLLIAFYAGRPLTLLQLAYADIEDVNTALNAPFDLFIATPGSRTRQARAVIEDKRNGDLRRGFVSLQVAKTSLRNGA
jgi:hypothetical protein